LRSLAHQYFEQFQFVFVDDLRTVEIVDIIFEEDMLVIIVSCVAVLFLCFELGPQFLVDKEDGFAEVMGLETVAFVEETGQKDAATEPVVLTVHVDSMPFAHAEEVVDRVDCDYQFVEGQVRVVLKAQMVNFSVLPLPQNLSLQLRRIPILSDVPDLKVYRSYMLMQFLEEVIVRVDDVKEARNDFDGFELLGHLCPEFVVVFGEVLYDLVLFELAQHAGKGAQHYYK
jgi:hypothetical protein